MGTDIHVFYGMQEQSNSKYRPQNPAEGHRWNINSAVVCAVIQIFRGRNDIVVLEVQYQVAVSIDLHKYWRQSSQMLYFTPAPFKMSN